jgi:hypothetical protein
METAIKNVCDITYLSELILDIEDVKDLIRTDNLRSLTFRKLCAH